MIQRLLWPALFGAVLLSACTKTNPNARLDGSAGDGPQRRDTSRPPGTPGGPCLPGGLCNPGLKCESGICVPEFDGGQWDLWPATDGPRPPDQAPQCSPVGFRPVVTSTDAKGDWTVVAEPQTKASPLSLTGAKGKEAGTLLDLDAAGVQVAGFVLSRQTVYPTASQEATAAVQELGQALGSGDTLTIRSPGSQRQTHDGFQAQVLLTLDLKLASPTTVSKAQVKAVAALLQLPIGNLGALPPAYGVSNTELVLRMALVLRKDNRTVFIGAVTDKASDGNPAKLTSTLARDLASTTLLARAGVTPTTLCDSQTVTSTPKNEVDIIWVMDESGSMDDKRAAIAAGASTLFTQLQQSGLDFRMGVTNVCDPGGAFASAVGKFCSTISTNQNDMGGPDRFLLPAEQTTFAACIKNPPGQEPAQEYGLVNAEEAVKRHLPRAASDPAKIRSNAQVVIIVVTDEAPQGLKNLVPNPNVFKQCTLNTSVQSQVDAHVQPYIDYLSGTSDPGAKVDYFQVIGGVCNSSCSYYQPDVAHGYLQLAQALNGQVYDVCQADLGSAVSSIFNGIVATASTFNLQQVPIASSLSVALDGTTLQRSNTNGFRHVAGTKDLSFVGSAQLQQGSTVVASYQRWN